MSDFKCGYVICTVSSMDKAFLFCRKMEDYRKQYEALKGMRTLKWIPSLGVVKLDLELAGRTQSFSVSPARAAVIYHFENQGKFKCALNTRQVWGSKYEC